MRTSKSIIAQLQIARLVYKTQGLQSNHSLDTGVLSFVLLGLLELRDHYFMNEACLHLNFGQCYTVGTWMRENGKRL